MKTKIDIQEFTTSNDDMHTNEFRHTFGGHLFSLYYSLEQLGRLFEMLPLALKTKEDSPCTPNSLVQIRDTRPFFYIDLRPLLDKIRS